MFCTVPLTFFFHHLFFFIIFFVYFIHFISFDGKNCYFILFYLIFIFTQAVNRIFIYVYVYCIVSNKHGFKAQGDLFIQHPFTFFMYFCSWVLPTKKNWERTTVSNSCFSFIFITFGTDYGKKESVRRLNFKINKTSQWTQLLYFLQNFF